MVQQRSRVKDLFSLVGYDNSCLAAIRHVKSIIRVIQPRQKYAPTASCFIIIFYFNRFAPENFAEKTRVFKLVEPFSGHCLAMNS